MDFSTAALALSQSVSGANYKRPRGTKHEKSALFFIAFSTSFLILAGEICVRIQT